MCPDQEVRWNEETIREISDTAYFKWVDAGSPHGQDKHFWNLAEQEMIDRLQPKEELIEVNYSAPKKLPSNAFKADSVYFYVPYVPMPVADFAKTCDEFVDLSKAAGYKEYNRLRDELDEYLEDRYY